MKMTLIVFLLIYSFQSRADAVTKAAFNYAQKALFSYSTPNSLRKKTEKKLLSLLPFQKEKALIFGSVGVIIVSGKISTRSFKNISIGFLGWNVVPELNFDTKKNEMFTLISINKHF